MSFLPYPPPPEPGWYDDDATVMPPFADSAMPGTVQSQPMEQVSMLLEPINDESVNDEPANDDDIDWDGTVLSSAFTMKQPKLEYTLYNEQTGQEVIIDMGVLLGRKSSVEVPEGAKSVKLEDPTRTISRNHAAISFDQDGTLWIEDYGSLNGTYIIQGNEETKVEHKPIKFEAPCTIRIGDQFFTLEQR
ncbi:FHA domain-containing protein [Bifidobacterium catenulatum]|uniref:FHA domain-containing protein n=1 Tax=Bifidobacterium catenulatum TaxID=1686 RepID=UPI0022DEC0ED|nr:FHA domain-containing protein [Bifidobacterium catenulatum]